MKSTRTRCLTKVHHEILKHVKCSDALSYIHSEGYLHNDFNGDNETISDNKNTLQPVIIHFGQTARLSKGKLYKLSQRNQDKCKKYHTNKGIEVVRGTHLQSQESDI